MNAEEPFILFNAYTMSRDNEFIFQKALYHIALNIILINILYLNWEQYSSKRLCKA